MVSDGFAVNGVLIWYYNICKRQVWLMAHNILPDKSHDDIQVGRFIHENTFKRNDKEVYFGNVRFDVVFQSKEKIVIGETKKSSWNNQASKYQLLFYLKLLKENGIEASGVLLYPEQNKRESIELTSENILEVERMQKEIIALISEDKPRPAEKNLYCKNCAYSEYCYA